jgi:hypothetical protein
LLQRQPEGNSVRQQQIDGGNCASSRDRHERVDAPEVGETEILRLDAPRKPPVQPLPISMIEPE